MTKGGTFAVLETDLSFPDSPNAGRRCLCSRCGEAILVGPVLRIWPPATMRPPSLKEFRYHLRCAGITAATDLTGATEIGLDIIFCADDPEAITHPLVPF